MIDKYTIELDKNNPPIIEIALTEFMAGVFKLAEESNCVGIGLTITKIE